MQNRILREHPWAALELFKALQRSKEIAYERARRAQSVLMYFPGQDFQDQAKALGKTRIPLESKPWVRTWRGRFKAP